MCVFMYVYVCTYLCMCVGMYTHMCMYVCIYEWMDVFIYVLMYVCMYVVAFSQLTPTNSSSPSVAVIVTLCFLTGRSVFLPPHIYEPQGS